MKITVAPKGRYYMMLRKGGIGVCYKEKNKTLVLRDEVHWTKINGIWFNTKWGCLWIEFRRYVR